jgi:predicted NAD/FAD-dependent oxidoreductase
MTAPRARVAIVGAGVSGSMCARQLAVNGFEVTVFDKGRGSGGRTATRRIDASAFDHGAQYFTSRDPKFRYFVDQWLEDGLVTEWSGPLALLRSGDAKPMPNGERYVGMPGMNALTRDLLRGSDSRFETTVKSVRRKGESWYLTFLDRSDAGPFDVLIVATPPSQAFDLAQGETPLVEQAANTSMEPCWATVLGFPSRIEFPFDGAFVESSPLCWIARNTSKPGRENSHEIWVLHASEEWSRSHLESSRESVGAALTDAFEAAVGRLAEAPRHLLTHRWRYARPTRSGGPGSLFDSSSRIGFCGDWLTGGRVESAALSGMQLADRVISGESS